MVEKAMTRREYKFKKREILRWMFCQRSKEYLAIPKKFQVRHSLKPFLGENGRFYHLVKDTDAKRARRSINNENEEEEEKKQSSSQLDRKNQIISDLQL